MWHPRSPSPFERLALPASSLSHLLADLSHSKVYSLLVYSLSVRFEQFLPLWDTCSSSHVISIYHR